MPREKEEVEKVAIVELKITKPASKTKFVKSEKFTTDGLEVTLVYSDGSEVVTNNYEISPKVGDILAQSGFKNVIIKPENNTTKNNLYKSPVLILFIFYSSNFQLINLFVFIFL